MKLTLWEHLNDNAPKLKNWQMVERQDPAIWPGLCLQAKDSDIVGKVPYSIDGSDFIHGGLRKYSAFMYDGEKKVFFPYFNKEPLLMQEITPNQILDFKHAVPLSARRPLEGRYDTIPPQRRELMESQVQEAYRFYVLSELVKPALQQELGRHGFVMVSSGGEISFPIIVEKGKEKSTSSDDTIAVCTDFGDGTGKRIQKLERCQKRAEIQLREIYSSLETRFGYKVEIASVSD